MNKRIVIALGGNALGLSFQDQMTAVGRAAKIIAGLVRDGYEVVVSHGNGPQVGMIDRAMGMLAAEEPDLAQAPLSVCVAMTQGYIGYDLQNFLREELLRMGIDKPVTSLVTQVVVDRSDEAFANPTKPIGRFMDREEAAAWERRGCRVIEDSGRGYRRVVPSPKPVDIVEIETIRSLLDGGQVVVACGGGGIPVVREGCSLRGVSAVIDKDFASARLAQMIGADYLVILTAVERVAVNYAKPDQRWLSWISVEEARAYIAQGQFAPGSMLPKVEAAVEFASSLPGRRALITLLEKAGEGLKGETGTVICA